MLMRRQYAGVNELARALHVNKAAVSRRLARLEARGEIETREGPYRSKLVDVAAFGRAAGIDAERFEALPTMIECMSTRGQLGEGYDLRRRCDAATRYFGLLQRAASDAEAQKCVEKLDAALGSIDRGLLHAVIVENRSASELSKLCGRSAMHLLERVRAALDLIAGQ